MLDKTIIEEGRQARRDGKPDTANPYFIDCNDGDIGMILSSRKVDAWNSGWFLENYRAEHEQHT